MHRRCAGSTVIPSMKASMSVLGDNRITINIIIKLMAQGYSPVDVLCQEYLMYKRRDK